jgi:Mrp family chromosome partitioning ATPase
MSRLIVIKSHSHFQGNTGVVIPLIIEEDGCQPRAVHQDEFENGNKLFIADDYQVKIDELYREDELFVVSSWNETDRDDWKTTSSKQRYISFGNLVRPLEKSSYLPIIDMRMPDVSTGTVDSIPSGNLANSHFMVRSDGFINGPFTAQHNGTSWSVSPVTVNTPLSLQTHNIAQFSESDLDGAGLLISINLNGTVRKFLSSLERAKHVEHDVKDYISDAGLITYYTKNGFGKNDKNTLSRTEASKLKAAIEAYKKTQKAVENNDRLSRLKEILDSYLSSEGTGLDIIDSYLNNTSNGKEFLEKFVRENRDVLLKDKGEELRKRLEEQKERIDLELSKLNAEIDQKKQEFRAEEKKVLEQKIISEKEIEEIKKKTAAQIKEESLKGQEELREDIRRLEERKELLDAELKLRVDEFAELVENLKLPKEIQGIQFTLKERENQLETVKRSLYDTEKLVQRQTAYLSSPDLSNVMLEHKTISQILSGQRATPAKMIKPYFPKVSKTILDDSNRGDYVEDLKKKLEIEDGRQFHFDEVGNLIITMMQSFLTVLSGPPGTGKTSTVTRLAKHLELTSDDETETVQRFINIPVGKGWVSNRDLLGFWNGLKNIYQPSRSGLYEFLRAAEVSNTELPNDFLNMVLLDEANLSSIEHYWSDFLILSDTFNSLGNRINLGIQDADKQHLRIPQSLRFIATINSDETTERLSPRLIDRAPVISLTHAQFTLPVEGSGENEFDGALPFSNLNSAFNPTDLSFALSDTEETNLKSIITTLSSAHNRAAPIHLSPRKIQAIHKYCKTANELLYQRYQPMDFAISQHVLPMINGFGKGYRERLNQLHQKLGECNYEISRNHLNSIIERGDEMMDSYSFF